MAFNIGKMSLTVRDFLKQIEKGNITYDNYIQRGDVWSEKDKSLLIDTILNRYIIPPMHFSKSNEGIYDAIDGRQRTTTIYKYVNNEFALSGLDPVMVDDDSGNEMDVNGLTFSELSEDMQNSIKDYVLDMIYVENCDQAVFNQMFMRINMGKPLKSFMKVRANCEYMDEFHELAGHPAIQRVMTPSRASNKTDDLIAMQMYILLYTDIPSFVPADIEETIVHAELKQSQFKQMNEILDLAEAVITNGFDPETKADKKIITKLKVQNHFIALIYLCSKVKDEDKVIDLVRKFFGGSGKGASIDASYNSSCGPGANTPTAIKRRIDALNNLMR